MEITKVVKPFIRRGWPNTFGYTVYISIQGNMSYITCPYELPPNIAYISDGNALVDWFEATLPVWLTSGRFLETSIIFFFIN